MAGSIHDQRGGAPAPVFEPGQRVAIEAEIVESFAGDTCVRVEVGDKQFRQSFWVPTRTVTVR